MHRREYLITATGLLTLTAGCMGDDDQEEDREEIPETATVAVNDGAYSPLHSHVGIDGTVTWENTGDTSHRVDAFQFHADSTGWTFSTVLEPGESATHTFDAEGLYDFTDQAHGQFSMCGRIRVGHVEEGSSLPCE